MAGPLRVLFVCAGNTCRSPMAEALLRDRLAAEGLAGRVLVASAGVSARPGDPANPATLAVLAAHGISHTGQARRFDAALCARSDFIIALDRATLDAVTALCPMGEDGPVIRLLLDYAPGAGVQDVFDPFGSDRYPEAFALIREGVTGLLAALRPTAAGKEPGI